DQFRVPGRGDWHWSPDGKRIAFRGSDFWNFCKAGEDRWDPLLRAGGPILPAGSLAFSPKDELVALLRKEMVQLFTRSTGEKVGELRVRKGGLDESLANPLFWS